MKYAVVWIYGTGDGRMTGYSKPRVTYDSVKDARLAAKRAHARGKQGMWIVQIHADGSATILGQVWHPYGTWLYHDYLKDPQYILKSDGSLGKVIDWSSNDWRKSKKL